jgi:hypothetical protein
VEPLINAKNAVGVLHFETDSVIFHREQPVPADPLDTDTNLRRFFTPVFNGIFDEVLKHARQLIVGDDGRQFVNCHAGISFVDLRPQL